MHTQDNRALVVRTPKTWTRNFYRPPRPSSLCPEVQGCPDCYHEGLQGLVPGLHKSAILAVYRRFHGIEAVMVLTLITLK